MSTTRQPWPVATDFNVMLQRPDAAFRDAELKTCTIERDVNNQPRAWSGSFAAVYKGVLAGGKGQVAIRVFSTAAEERRERYEQIRDYLDNRSLRCMVKFQYSDNGIRCAKDGKWYPLVTMDWVQGNTLYDWVREKCQQRGTSALSRAADDWIEMIQELSAASIAHGDLQHGNVMVTGSNQFKLVDYDCMCVPALVGRKNLEIGVEPYQNPQRDEKTVLFPGLDNFSAIFILTALRAFAAKPDLWSAYVEKSVTDRYDKLLFRREDFDNPHQSRLFGELRQSSDRKLRKLADELIGFWRSPLQDIPPLADLVSDFDAVRQLLNQKAWDDAVELLNRNQAAKVPPDLQATVDEARYRVQCRTELEEAVARGDEEEMQRSYVPKLLDNYPKAEASVRVAKQAAQVIPVLRDLNAAQQSRDARRLVQIWDANQSLLSGRKSTAKFQGEVDQWRQRNQACDALLDILSRSPVDVSRLKEAWRRLESVNGHPEADRRRDEIQAILRKNDALTKLRSVSRTLSQENDAALDAAWDETIFRGWDEAEQERPAVEAARDRLACLSTLRNLVQKFPDAVAAASEQEIVSAASRLPSQYQVRQSVRNRVHQARRRLQAIEKLKSIMASPTLSESSLADAWDQITKLEATSLVPAGDRPRLELAVQRRPLLENLSRISLKLPLDQLDRTILSHWNDDLLKECAEAASWKERFDEAKNRKRKLKELERAIGSDDDSAIAECLKAPLLRGYPFSETVASRLKQAQARMQVAEALLHAVKQNEPKKFFDLFDSRIVRDYAERFAPFRTVIQDWLTAKVASREILGLRPPLVGRAIHPGTGKSDSFRVQWQWPAPRFADECVLGICRMRPGVKSVPDEAAEHRILIQRKAWEAGGGYYTIRDPRWNGNYVAIWACLNLGFSDHYSEPLILGRLERELSSRNEP
jgi:serine/threonine protein kinase